MCLGLGLGKLSWLVSDWFKQAVLNSDMFKEPDWMDLPAYGVRHCHQSGVRLRRELMRMPHGRALDWIGETAEKALSTLTEK